MTRKFEPPEEMSDTLDSIDNAVAQMISIEHSYRMDYAVSAADRRTWLAGLRFVRAFRKISKGVVEGMREAV